MTAVQVGQHLFVAHVFDDVRILRGGFQPRQRVLGGLGNSFMMLWTGRESDCVVLMTVSVCTMSMHDQES